MCTPVGGVAHDYQTPPPLAAYSLAGREGRGVVERVEEGMRVLLQVESGPLCLQ